MRFSGYINKSCDINVDKRESCDKEVEKRERSKNFKEDEYWEWVSREFGSLRGTQVVSVFLKG